MPELPDVEAFRDVLARYGTGRRIERVHVQDDDVLHDTTPQALGRALKGQAFTEPARLGKWLLAHTDGSPTLLLHFGMTGELHWCSGTAARHQHDRVVFQLPDGEIRYRDMRKLQGLRIARDDTEVQQIISDEGPDALRFDHDDLASLLSGSRKQLKSLLTDQSAIAGLGNLLVDEILWQTRLHPAYRAKDIDADSTRRLYGQMRRILSESVTAGCVPPEPAWLTGSRDALPAPCPRCGGWLSRERRGGRSTVLCPHCQPEPGG